MHVPIQLAGLSLGWKLLPDQILTFILSDLHQACALYQEDLCLGLRGNKDKLGNVWLIVTVMIQMPQGEIYTEL